jgi:hypothetical protein
MTDRLLSTIKPECLAPSAPSFKSAAKNVMKKVLKPKFVDVVKETPVYVASQWNVKFAKRALMILMTTYVILSAHTFAIIV